MSIHAPNPVTIPTFIPKYWPMSERLISHGIKLIRKINPDIIDAGYFLPYVFAGWVLHKKTGIPVIIRHAGSDIERILKNESLNFLYREIVSEVNGVITTNGMRDFFLELGVNESKIFIPSHQRSVPLDFFNPSVGQIKIEGLNDKINLFLPGKPSKGKGVYNMIRTLSELQDDGLNVSCLFTAGPKGKEFLNKIAERYGVANKVIIKRYFPPWMMPTVYRSLDIVVCPEHNFGVNSHGSMIPREALSVGTPVIVSKDISRSFPYSTLDLPTFDPQVPGHLKETIFNIIHLIERDSYQKDKGIEFSKQFENINLEVKDTMDIYQEVME